MMMMMALEMPPSSLFRFSVLSFLFLEPAFFFLVEERRSSGCKCYNCIFIKDTFMNFYVTG